jgi:hypothetical protein
LEYLAPSISVEDESSTQKPQKIQLTVQQAGDVKANVNESVIYLHGNANQRTSDDGDNDDPKPTKAQE